MISMGNIRKIIDHLTFNRINVYKTLLINFVYLPFKDALKLPIWVRGKCKIAHLGKGKIKITGKIKTGMFGIGNSDPVRSFFEKSFLDIQGILEVESGVVLRRGIRLSIAPYAVVRLDRNVLVSDNSTIISWDSIHIQSNTILGNNLLMMDTDFHYIMNRESYSVRDNHASIVIGENNWIGAWCVVKKGTQTPKGVIIAGPYSMIDKNCVGKIPEYCMLAGSPVKFVKGDLQMVMNPQNEEMLKRYFQNTNLPYVLPSGFNVDAFCAV